MTGRNAVTTLDRPMDPPPRKLALIAGLLFILTFVTAIPAVLLYDPVLNDPEYIVGAGADTRVLVGAFLELVLIIANIGTALALFAVLSGRTRASRSAT